MRVTELPVGAGEDRVVGSLDMEAALADGRRRFEHGLLALLALAAAWPLQRWLQWSRAASLGVVWLLALAVFSGPMPVLATALLAATAIGLGSLLLRGAIALPIGLAMARVVTDKSWRYDI